MNQNSWKLGDQSSIQSIFLLNSIGEFPKTPDVSYRADQRIPTSAPVSTIRRTPRNLWRSCSSVSKKARNFEAKQAKKTGKYIYIRIYIYVGCQEADGNAHCWMNQLGRRLLCSCLCPVRVFDPLDSHEYNCELNKNNESLRIEQES